jgi:hypothetical protein
MREQPDMPGGSGNVVAVFTMDCRTRQLRRPGQDKNYSAARPFGRAKDAVGF